jgi:hypothetical protein
MVKVIPHMAEASWVVKQARLGFIVDPKLGFSRPACGQHWVVLQGADSCWGPAFDPNGRRPSHPT